MKLTEISKEKTPEKFYVDNYGEWAEAVVIPVQDGYRLRRKAKEGFQDLHFFADRLELRHIVDSVETLVAVGQIYLEWLNFETNEWLHYAFGDATVSILDDHTIQATQTDNGVSLTVEAEWRIGSAKQTYTATYPGKRIRIGGVVKVLSDELILDYSDFLGIDLVDDQEQLIDGDIYRFLKFSSDGVLDFLEVDPYLSVAEPTNQIKVQCDGFYALFDKADTSTMDTLRIFSDADLELAALVSQFRVGSDYYVYDNGSVPNITILSDTPTRVVVSISGNYRDSGLLEMPDSTGYVHKFNIYPDRVSIQTVWTTTSEIVTYSNRDYQRMHSWFPHGNIADEVLINEDNGSEVTGTTGEVDAANYIGWTSTPVNIFGICIDSSDPNFGQWSDSTSLYSIQLFGTIPAGVHNISSMWVIDSAGREHGSKLYDATGRLSIGEQYKDISLTLTNGTAKTDLTEPLSIGSSGFASDGAWHLEMT